MNEPTSPLPEGRLSGRIAFEETLRLAFETAAQEGWTQIVLSDADFVDWPLGERRVIEALDAWASRGRTLHIMARSFQALREQHPRFVRWRVLWGHIVEARACPDATDDDLPSAFWSNAWSMERLDPVHASLVASRESARRLDLQQRVQAWWVRGTPAFAATTLGL